MVTKNNTSGYRYYLHDVDTQADAIYCHHGLTEEILIQNHNHKKAQFLYTEGGIVHVQVGENSYFLPARHYMWIPAGVFHSIHPSSESVTMRNLYFPVIDANNLFYEKLAIYPVNDFLFQFILFTKQYSGEILPSDKVKYDILMAFKLLLTQLGDVALPLSLPIIKEPRLKQISFYLDSHLNLKFNFKVLSSQFGFSERSLSRLFNAELNMTFIQYVNILRMLRSLKYLLNDKLPVNEVAGLVGYSSVPTFSNTFQKILGVRPSIYIKTTSKII